MSATVTTSDELREFVHEWIKQNPIEHEGTQHISIEPIDWFVLSDGKPLAEYSHRIKLSFSAENDRDQATRNVLVKYMEKLVFELRNRCKYVMFSELLSVYWSTKYKNFVGAIAIQL